MERNLKILNKFLDKKYLPAGVLIIFFVLVIISNRWIASSLNKPAITPKATSKITVDEIIAEKLKAQNNAKQGLEPDDPAEFGIIAHRTHEIPRTQIQWDFNMKRYRSKSNVFTQLKKNKAFKGAQTSPASYQGQLQRINQRINDYEILRRAQPYDPDIQKKLQKLYMLKSTLRIMESSLIDMSVY